MINFRRVVFACIVAVLTVPQAAQAAPTITVLGGTTNDRIVTAGSYTATISGDGYLSSLKVGASEFLQPGIDVSRGAYLFQHGLMKLDNVTQTTATSIDAKSADAEVHYDFGDTTVTTTITNTSAGPIAYYAIFPAEVTAAADPTGKLIPLADNEAWTTATWYRDAAKVTTTGSDRIWGPWVAGAEVLETDIAPNATRTVTYTPAASSPAEIAAVRALEGPDPLTPHSFTVLSPTTYQVFQRQSRTQGAILVSGWLDRPGDHAEVRVSGTPLSGTLPSGWQLVPSNATGFFGEIPTPAGGWYSVQVRDVHPDKTTSTGTIANVGVGEVFVGAGQSNSTNFAQFRTTQSSGMVAAFSGTSWSLANDPVPGPHDKSQGGSMWPSFGDDMYARFHVPIGVAPTGHGGTSVGVWQPGSELFNYMMLRVAQLGPHGFRALVWHQGEADIRMDSSLYATLLAKVIKTSQAEAGWDFPWFVAQVSYQNPTATSFDTTRDAQKKLWDLGIAMQGPDTDTLTGDNRDNGGNGIHLSLKGLAAHGALWAGVLGDYIDKQLTE